MAGPRLRLPQPRPRRRQPRRRRTTTSSGTAAAGASGATAGTTGTTGTAATAAQATPVPVQLTFAGGYTALNNLVRRLEGLVTVSGKNVLASGPLLSISNVSLSGSPLTVQLTASIYQLSAPTSTTSTTTGGQG